MNTKILAINPGSTSTKVAVYENDTQIFEETIRHTAEELKPFDSITDQYGFRKDVIEKVLKEKNFDINELNGIVGRGGLFRPIPGGTYRVSEVMVEELETAKYGEHASNLGGLIAFALGKSLDCPAFIVDPVVVDELEPVARISGHPEIERRSIFHALNQRAMARHYADETGKEYTDLNLIVVHLGGGISVGAHMKGRIIDVNDALSGEGPFSPERTGGLPAFQLAELCFSGKYTKTEMKKMLMGNGGVMAYMGTNDMRGIEDNAKAGDAKSIEIQNAMGYQVSKEIGKCATVLKGKVDAIIITGGIAYNPDLMAYIKERVDWIAEVVVYPGEEEMRSLAMGGYRVLSGQEKAQVY
ncbi:butyrate kinase [bacterium]|nr:butyrate kinase [bacterium]